MSQSHGSSELGSNFDFGFDQPEEGESNSSQLNDELSNYNKVLDCFNKTTERNQYSSNNVFSTVTKNRQNSGSKQHENLRKSKQNAQQIHLAPPVILKSTYNTLSQQQQSSSPNTLGAINQISQQPNLSQNQNQVNSKGNSSNTSFSTRGSVFSAKGKKIHQLQQGKNILNGLNVLNHQQQQENNLISNIPPMLHAQNKQQIQEQSQKQFQQIQHQQQLQQQQQYNEQQEQYDQQQQQQHSSQQIQQQQQQQQQPTQFASYNNYFQLTADQTKIKELIQQQSQQLQQQNSQINQNNSIFFQNKRPQNSDSAFDSTCSSTLVQESSYVTPRSTNKSLQNSFNLQGNLQSSQILNLNEMAGSYSSSQQQQQQQQINNNQGIYRNRNSISTHQVYQTNNPSSTNANISNIINNNSNSSGMCFGYNSKIVRQMSQLSVGDYSQQNQQQCQQQQNVTTTTPRGNDNFSMKMLHYPQHYQQGQNFQFSQYHNGNFNQRQSNYHHRHLSYSNSSSQQHSFALSQQQHSHFNQHSYSSNSNNQSFQANQGYHNEFMFSPMIHNQSNDSFSQNNCHLSNINSLNASFQLTYNSSCQIEDQNKSRNYKSDSLHITQQQQLLNESSQKIHNSFSSVSANGNSQNQQQTQFYSNQSGNSQQNLILSHIAFTPNLLQQQQQNKPQQNTQQQQFQQKNQGIRKQNSLQSSSKNYQDQKNQQLISNKQRTDFINQQSVSIQMTDTGISNILSEDMNTFNQNNNTNEVTNHVVLNQLSRKVRSITNNMMEQNLILEEEDDKLDKEADTDSSDEECDDKKQKSDDQNNKVCKKADKKSSKGTRKRKVIAQEEESNYLINPENVKQDCRTTVMIKNIPNKYSLQALMEKIDQSHSKTYDFFYLPIDFRNKCNVGYAFINFIDPEFIKPFYEEFHNQKWAKFNSEKVCLLFYARLQGRNALIHHFQHSSVMNQKDKKLKPVILPKNEVTALEQILKNQRVNAQIVCIPTGLNTSNSQINSFVQGNDIDTKNTYSEESKEKSKSKESTHSSLSNRSSSSNNLKEEKVQQIIINETQSQNYQQSIKQTSILNHISQISKSISPTNHEDIKQKQSLIAQNKSNNKKPQ